MKLTFLTLFILILNSPAFAQNECSTYMSFSEGTQWTTKNYDADDEYQGMQSYEVLSSQLEGEILMTTAIVIAYNKSDEVVFEKEIEFECKDGVFHMDMSKYIPEEAMKTFNEMDININYDDITIPPNLEVGQELSEGGVEVSVAGPLSIGMKVKIKDRKVEAKESITVPAGTFEAFKITSNVWLKAPMMDRKTPQVEWIAQGVGVVRTEHYNSDGDLKNYSVLASFNQ